MPDRRMELRCSTPSSPNIRKPQQGSDTISHEKIEDLTSLPARAGEGTCRITSQSNHYRITVRCQDLRLAATHCSTFDLRCQLSRTSMSTRANNVKVLHVQCRPLLQGSIKMQVDKTKIALPTRSMQLEQSGQSLTGLTTSKTRIFS